MHRPMVQWLALVHNPVLLESSADIWCPLVVPWTFLRKEGTYKIHHQEEQLEELLSQTKEMVDIVEVLEQVWKCIQSQTD